MRSLAHVEVIKSIDPIEGKDRIGLATVLGWQVIVNKADFNVGDLCVYVEIDSVVPETEQFEFLRKRDFRIRTMKMAGVLSQGICFPLSILPNGSYKEGDDVTQILGIKQYEPTQDIEREKDSNSTKGKKYPEFLMRMAWFRKLVCGKKQYRGFPTFVSKTDETRIQNAPFYLKNKEPFVATEKIDGQSGTFALVRHKSKIPFVKDKFEYIVCSRNLRLSKEDNSSYWSVSRKYNVKNALMYLIGDSDWVAIQGECIGPGIQKNKYKRKDYELYVFNLIYPEGRIGSALARTLIENRGLNFVPIVDYNFVLPDTVAEVLDYAHGTSELYDTMREGIVFRSEDGKTSFKAVDPLFLLKHNE